MKKKKNNRCNRSHQWRTNLLPEFLQKIAVYICGFYRAYRRYGVFVRLAGCNRKISPSNSQFAYRINKFQDSHGTLITYIIFMISNAAHSAETGSSVKSSYNRLTQKMQMRAVLCSDRKQFRLFWHGIHYHFKGSETVLNEFRSNITHKHENQLYFTPIIR